MLTDKWQLFFDTCVDHHERNGLIQRVSHTYLVKHPFVTRGVVSEEGYHFTRLVNSLTNMTSHVVRLSRINGVTANEEVHARVLEPTAQILHQHRIFCRMAYVDAIFHDAAFLNLSTWFLIRFAN